ncbi:hypothetical protein GGS20DRAFT_562376 [Poronia punctata]|nr:hypothetical protein GGS20DRAFT_562376 [Poronia punctata]
MANTLASLKSLPCPAGDNCTAFQCVFGHPRDASKAKATSKNSDISAANNSINHRNTPAAPLSGTRPTENTKHLVEVEEQPRKRAKLDIDGAATLLAKPAGSRIQKSDKQRNVSFTSPSTTKPERGSTLAMEHNRPLTASVNKQTDGTQFGREQPAKVVSQVPPNPPPVKPVTQSKMASKAPKGPEVLNPRLLNKAPASHPSRVALVKALHKEFKRLNDELKETITDAEKKLLLSEQELIVKTLDDEQEIATKKTLIYNTSIRNRIMMYKRMTVLQWKEERTKATQCDNQETTKPVTEIPVSIDTGLSTSQEIEFLPRLVTDLKGLGKFGYITSAPSDADVKTALAAIEACGNTETCDRCTRRFQVFPGRRESDGALASNGPCTHHPGKAYYVDRVPGDRLANRDRERKYRCCQRAIDDEAGGCTTAANHVFKTTDPKRLAAVLNFAETPINPNVPKDRAVCFDCEMGYTVHGLELIRLTAVSWPDGAILLDILVQPVGEILDLNTRYSGVRPEDIALAEPCGLETSHEPTVVPTEKPDEKPRQRLKIAPSPRVARDLLFTLISAETPLIGHGLENDLNSVRIIHPTCIDTIILWPHSRGLPMRNGLKYLMQSKLGRTIQAETPDVSPEGHDSAEDARAAGDLVRLKIRDEWKSLQMKGWIIGPDGKLQAPAEEWTVVGGAKVKKGAFW